MKKMERRAERSDRPTLDGFRTIYKFMPERPNVARIISRGRRTICINLAARPGANIDVLTD